MGSTLSNTLQFHHYKYINYYGLSNMLGTFKYILCTALVSGGFQVYEVKMVVLVTVSPIPNTV